MCGNFVSADPESGSMDGDDIDALTAALLGELTAVPRTCIMLLVPSNVDASRPHE